jgi:hypothetical protein
MSGASEEEEEFNVQFRRLKMTGKFFSSILE